MRDRKGLITETYDNAGLGANFELYVNSPSPGLFWRYLRNELRGDDAMHGHGMAIIGDLHYGDEIWNYPIYKYEVDFTETSPYSGTITIYYAADTQASYLSSSTLYYDTVTYGFHGVRGDGRDPVDSGTWTGSGVHHRPDSIWRPYRAAAWTTYAKNPELQWTHLNDILWVKDDRYENNDSVASAYNLSAREKTWLSSIRGGGIQADDDWYKIYVSPGYTRVVVDCRFTHSNGDIDIALYNASGQQLAKSTSVSSNERIETTVPAGGVSYYIRVYYDNEGNQYNLWWDDLQP